MELTKIGVLSAAKINGLVGLLIGLIFGVLYGLFMIGLGAVAGEPSMVIMGIVMAIFMTIGYGVGGFIGGAIVSALYNVFASKVGGIEMTFKK